ncbi:four helix bundle protein [Paracrocinitomix mangrovi]|uniref:four helix bundle protein n=1 Tax=Paracrocinitomix mangrovi TaxID=2862509 RepID=UPI001C8D8B53|nr:four helix bundle protein [Paracrocinitomix mangrovi]UKN01008.1 four helix bundle protein [Paracrocinitomix mangrovi]
MAQQNENIILKKSYDFALKVVVLCRKIQIEEKEFQLSKQLYRSGTSIGANAEEAIGGVSKKDFANKLGISYKEARESKYWLRLMRDSELVDEELTNELIADVDELARILFSIIRSSKN